MYVKSTDVNGRPSWTSVSYAIWYSSDFKWWIIGLKADRDKGVDIPITFTKSQTGELPDENCLWFKDGDTRVENIKIYSNSNCQVVQNDGKTILQSMRNQLRDVFKPKIGGKFVFRTSPF